MAALGGKVASHRSANTCSDEECRRRGMGKVPRELPVTMATLPSRGRVPLELRRLVEEVRW